MGVNRADFSPDHSLIVTGSKDSTARIWRFKEHPPFSMKLPHQEAVWGASISPDGQHLASSSTSGRVRIWSLSGELRMEFKAHDAVVRTPAFSPDGQWLVTAGTDEKLRLWPMSGVSRGAAPKTYMHERHQEYLEYKALAFSPDKRPMRVAAGGSDGQVYFWQLAVSGKGARLELKQPLTPPKHKKTIRSIAFNSNGTQIITASEDRLVMVWDAVTGKELKRLDGHRDWVRSATFSPDDQRALTASHDGTARVWDLRETPRVIFTADHEGVAVRGAAFSPDGKHFATAAVDGLVRVWSLKNEGEQNPKPILVLSGHEDELSSISYVDESRLLTSSVDKTIRLWSSIKAESPDEMRNRLRKELDEATLLCLGAAEWTRHMGGEFPESSRQRSVECGKRLPRQTVPPPVANTRGGL
jgi:WD40 repeat protein